MPGTGPGDCGMTLGWVRQAGGLPSGVGPIFTFWSLTLLPLGPAVGILPSLTAQHSLGRCQRLDWLLRLRLPVHPPLDFPPALRLVLSET